MAVPFVRCVCAFVKNYLPDNVYGFPPGNPAIEPLPFAATVSGGFFPSFSSSFAVASDLGLGFTYLTPVSLIPHHLASLWKSSVDAVVFASLRAGI
jgi:hypothetical protein